MASKRPGRRPALMAVAVCCAVLLAGVAVAQAQPPAPSSSPAAGRAGDDAIGASSVLPAGWRVERERYAYEDTYGFTLWEPNPAATVDQGAMPAVRVALASDLKPGQIEGRVKERLADLSDVPAGRREVAVGEKGYRGVAVGPVPGSTPSVEVYVPVRSRVYRINVYREGLDAQARGLLAGIRFAPPSRSAASLERIPDANAPETLYREDAKLAEREEAARKVTAGDASGETLRTASLAAYEVPTYEERQIAEGCWLAASRFYFQIQHGAYANGYTDDPGADAPTGYTVVGRPNFWGEATHGNLGYGRCNSPVYTNDKFAVDYPYNQGDVIFSPFYRGTVTFAGRNTSHKGYGVFVVIKDSGGKYFSLSAHLSSLAAGIRPGAPVDRRTVIGYAGDSGDPSIPVGEVHLHQAFYRYPKLNSDGSPYGGQGLQAVYHRYFGNGGGVYKFGWTADSATKSKGSLVSY